MCATCQCRVQPASLGRSAVKPSQFVLCGPALKQDPAVDEWRGVRDACSLIAARCNLACSLLWPTNTLTHIRAQKSMQTHSRARTHGTCSNDVHKLFWTFNQVTTRFFFLSLRPVTAPNATEKNFSVCLLVQEEVLDLLQGRPLKENVQKSSLLKQTKLEWFKIWGFGFLWAS